MEKVKVALIGYGGMARVHNAAYQKMVAADLPISLVAVCERDIARVHQRISINLGNEDLPLSESVHLYTDVDDLIAREDFDMADICLPTFLHKDFAIKLLRAGKHVLCEKPMALSAADSREMLEAARAADRRLLIGQCVRLEPGYPYLKACIDQNILGPLRYMTMHRLSGYPRWGAHFNDIVRTGGCLLDMHIHDVDMAQYALGMPQSVSCVEYYQLPHCQLVNSRLQYEGCTVFAEATWEQARQVLPFSYGYRATFESGVVVCEDGAVTVYPNEGEPYQPALAEEDYMVEEISVMLRAIQTGEMETVLSAESVYKTMQLMECLQASAQAGGKEMPVAQPQ